MTHPLERILKAVERDPRLRDDMHVYTATYVQQVKHYLNTTILPLDRTSEEYQALYTAALDRAQYRAGKDCLQLARNRLARDYTKGHHA